MAPEHPFHAGYPLCAQLWPKLAAWVIEHETPDSEFRQAIDFVHSVHGPVEDVESTLTEVDQGLGAFGGLPEERRGRLLAQIRRCIRRYFADGWQHAAPLYAALSDVVVKGDILITLNYDVSLECELIRVGKFRVRNGYGFKTDWDEPESDIEVLKPHGSINWIGSIFGGSLGYSTFVNSLGEHPLVDNRDSLLGDRYPKRVLSDNVRGGVTESEITLILPTHEKRFHVTSSVGDEWVEFYESLWSKSAEALQQSDRVVVIGYSLPPADKRARAVFLWSAPKGAEIVLCCAQSNPLLKANFEDHGYWRIREGGTLPVSWNCRRHRTFTLPVGLLLKDLSGSSRVENLYPSSSGVSTNRASNQAQLHVARVFGARFHPTANAIIEGSPCLCPPGV